MVPVDPRGAGVRRQPHAAERGANRAARALSEERRLGVAKSVGAPFTGAAHRSLGDFTAASRRYHARRERGAQECAMTAESRQLSPDCFAVHAPLARLPLVTLYVTDRCNSRCVTCDYWRHGRDDMDLAAVTRLLPSLSQLHTQMVLLSGGEPLLHPEWAALAELLRAKGLKVW